jgi:hypothetical protein
MDEGAIGIIVLVFISVLVSLVFHVLYNDYTNASLMSGMLSITIFLVISHIVSGPEKFLLIAFAEGGFLSIIISLAVGGIIYAVKKYIIRKK